MSIRVNVMPALGVVQILDLEDGNFILLRRNQCSAFLAEFMDAMADSIPEQYSIRVPDLTLVEGGAA